MPIWDIECECGMIFEYLQVRSDDFPTCPKCGSRVSMSRKLFNMAPNIRMDSDSILRSMPDPVPPLRELIGKGTEGYKELEGDQRELKDYTSRKNRQGNTEWIPKEKTYVDLGKEKKEVTNESKIY